MPDESIVDCKGFQTAKVNPPFLEGIKRRLNVKITLRSSLTVGNSSNIGGFIGYAGNATAEKTENIINDLKLILIKEIIKLITLLPLLIFVYLLFIFCPHSASNGFMLLLCIMFCVLLFAMDWDFVL